jgi:hypothetical protein
MPSKLWKMVLWTILLLAAGFWFGSICRRMGLAHQLLVLPFRELSRLLLWLLLCMMLLSILSGMAAVLFRPPWAACAALSVSGFAMWLGWGLTLRNAGLTTLYVLASFLYTVLTQRDLQQRVHFSVRPVAQNWRLVTVVMLVLAVGSFYLGFYEHVREKGLQIPDSQMDDVTGDIAAEVVDGTPLSTLQTLREELLQQVQNVLKEQLRRLISRVERFVPPLAAGMLFLLLFAVTGLLWWIPLLIVYVLVPLLISLRVAHLATETIRVQRLVFR